jgi:DNA-binding transcriptional LysR family regulator
MCSGADFVGHGASKESIFALVADGYGITLAVESQSALAGPGVVFRPVCESDACVDVSLVWLPQREEAVAGLFVAFVRDQAPANVPPVT